MYVIMVREKGLFVVEPVAGEDTRTTVENALGLKGGYSSGLVALDVPEGSGDIWIAWVEGEANGKPYFEYRALDGALSEEEATQRLQDAGEEPLKLNQTTICWAPAGDC